MITLLGYADRWSAAPGDSLRFMVSCGGVSSYRAELVRITSPRLGPTGPPFSEEIVDVSGNGDYPAREQPIPAGSYVVVDAKSALEKLESFTVQAFVWPTLPGDGYQALLGTWSEATTTGFGLGVATDGSLELRLGMGQGLSSILRTDVPLESRHWYLVAASYDSATGIARLMQLPEVGHRFVAQAVVRRETGAVGFRPGPGPFLMAAQHQDNAEAGAAWRDLVTSAHYNGKIDRPRLASRSLDEQEILQLAAAAIPSELQDSVVAAWDFGADIPTVRVSDLGPNGVNGECVNLPARAMAGHNWSGETADWRAAPNEYGAIHFHDDDIYDCRWQTDFTLTLPETLKSGIYAVRLRAEDAEYHITVFVCPKRGSATADVAYLAPTATYLAYANSFTYQWDELNEMINGALNVIDRTDLMQWEHREVGLSAYDHHRDGSGVCYSSRLRPVLNVRPTGKLWNFPIDLLIIDWLEQTGIGYDVITDDALHQEGRALLSRYRVLVSASHPEYYSLPMLDSTEAWLRDGGRLMYLGGNGYYWRIAYHSDLPGVIEVRRAEGGIRCWAAEPGEYHQSFNGELGGLWRRQRRAPNMIAGVGFVSQGFDAGSYYRRRPEANDPRTAFIFEGVDDEILGDFGLCLGGAASLEIDCVDASLGTPSHTLVLASSEMHSNIYELVPEELLQSHPMTDASQNPYIRADMVFFETPNGGAVFSTGSIGYAGSFYQNNYNNNIARLTTNVLNRFVDPQPFEMPEL